MKRAEGDQPIRITNESDIEKLRHKWLGPSLRSYADIHSLLLLYRIVYVILNYQAHDRLFLLIKCFAFINNITNIYPHFARNTSNKILTLYTMYNKYTHDKDISQSILLYKYMFPHYCFSIKSHRKYLKSKSYIFFPPISHMILQNLQSNIFNKSMVHIYVIIYSIVCYNSLS